ncbi:MAG TPA: MSMEG_0567/Sll0786 family nitrogen starvation N-acetyltransferase, partial [Actinomycetales bacterium]
MADLLTGSRLTPLHGNVLLGQQRGRPAFTITVADGSRAVSQYRALRHDAFVLDQALFDHSDLDEMDDDPRLVVLVARDRSGAVVGGVRLGPAPACTGPDIGWWVGGRLVVDPAATARAGVAAALVRAACAHAEQAGVLRFEATVQTRHAGLFTGLGWQPVAPVDLAGRPHLLVRWPVDRVQRLAASTKAALGPLLAGLHLGGAGFVGDDGA